jgi:hypothetical protein
VCRNAGLGRSRCEVALSENEDIIEEEEIGKRKKQKIFKRERKQK